MSDSCLKITIIGHKQVLITMSPILIVGGIPFLDSYRYHFRWTRAYTKKIVGPIPFPMASGLHTKLIPRGLGLSLMTFFLRTIGPKLLPPIDSSDIN